MKTIIHVLGEVFETDFDKSEIESGDTSGLYTFVCEQFSTNEWTDIVCDWVKYYPDYMEISISIYSEI